MAQAKQAAGGGRVIEVEPERVVGWVTRFGAAHGGVSQVDQSLAGVHITTADGGSARLDAPFPPMPVDGSVDPLESLLAHVDGLGDLATILVRERAFSVGVCRAGAVVVSSTDTRYVQSRTAAGGWSQQRYARRRDNQRRDSYRAAADAAARVLASDGRGQYDGLVVAGDRQAIDTVLADVRLAALVDLPRRTFLDIAEPRRAVLDQVAKRALTVRITIAPEAPISGT